MPDDDDRPSFPMMTTQRPGLRHASVDNADDTYSDTPVSHGTLPTDTDVPDVDGGGRFDTLFTW